MILSGKRVAILAGLAVVVLVAALFVTALARKGPPGRIVLAAGGGDGVYQGLAETLKNDLKRNGVTLELRSDLMGSELLKALRDPKSGVDGGIIKGGYMGSLTGRLASAKARDRHEEEAAGIRSVGRLMLEPIWVFTRGDLPIASLRDLEGKKILTGKQQSGARRVAVQLLRANGVNRDNSVLIEQDLPEDGKPLLDGQADAAVLILAPETDRIQKLLRVEDIRLMDFTAEAKAYTSRFPALTSVVLSRASVEFEPVIPSADITLLATSAALVVRRELHPSLTSLLAHAVIHNPKPPTDKSGDPVLFHKAGQFPNADDPEYVIGPEVRAVFKSGELPVLLRTLAPLNQRLGLPFSLTSFANSYGATLILLLIPLLTILVPMFRIVPWLYRWSIRQRLLHWYAELKALEGRLERAPSSADREHNIAEIERIDAAVRRIRVPLEFSDQLYDLRAHVDLVRRRLHQRPALVREAAE